MVEIISEIGQNFQSDINFAKMLIHEAKRCGANTAKFQFYNVDLIYKPTDRWYAWAKNCQLSIKDVKALMDECEKVGIDFLCSVFDENRVRWCEELGVKRYKIACRSFFDKPLLDMVEATGKEVIQSIPFKVRIPKHRRKNFKYLYCVDKYPARPEEVDILNIDFSEYDGFSDHTIGTAVPIMAMQQGARIIEKHFTLDKKAEGPDHAGSMTPNELECLVRYRMITEGA